jgi:protein-tyrosine phosphatase
MIDLHCHVLPGIDDGPDTLDGSLALARAAAAAGTRTILATPHVSPEYRNTARRIAGLLAEVNAAIAVEGLPLEVLAGAEVAASRIADMDPDELSALTLGDGSWLLVECPLGQSAAGFDTIVLYLKERGYSILLAHPERCPAFQRDPQMLRSLVDAGMLTSVTAGSLIGRFGKHVQRFAAELAAAGLLHNVASDAHDATRRPPGIGAALEQAGLEPLADWLTQAVPSAILAGTEIPRRPEVEELGLAGARSTQRSWWRRGR